MRDKWIMNEVRDESIRVQLKMGKKEGRRFVIKERQSKFRNDWKSFELIYHL